MKDVTPSVVAAVMALVVPVVAGAQGTAPLAADDAVAWCQAIADHIPGEPDTALFVAASWPSLRIERMLAALADGMKRVARPAARDDDATARLREALAPLGWRTRPCRVATSPASCGAGPCSTPISPC